MPRRAVMELKRWLGNQQHPGGSRPDPTCSRTPGGSNVRDQRQSQASREMLLKLGYTTTRSPVVRRLLAGSTERWPGLLRLYAGDGSARRSTPKLCPQAAPVVPRLSLQQCQPSA
jgi:hypothetical protein